MVPRRDWERVLQLAVAMMTRTTRWWRMALVAVMVTAASCTADELSPAEKEEGEKRLEAEFQAYLATANHCQQDSECTFIQGSRSCALGCYVAVRYDRGDEVLARIRQLDADLDRIGKGCISACPHPGPVTCVESRCRMMLP